MSEQPQPKRVHVQRLARAASAIAFLVGASGFIGWISAVPLLTSGLLGQATMKMNTAVAFMLAGASLALQSAHATPHNMWVRRACARLVAAIGGLTLTEYVLDIDLGIDRLLIHATATDLQSPSPERMAPNTALSFVLAGTALALVDSTSRALRAAVEPLAIGALLIGFLASTGYLLSVTALYDVPGYTSMSALTAFGIVVVSSGLLLTRPQRGVMAILTQDNSAGVAIRRLLPLIIVAPLSMAWLRLKGQQAGYFGTEFGLALTVTASTSIIAALALWNARVQGAADAARQQVLRDERFLLELGELLRNSSGSSDMLFDASKALGEYLGVSRCFFIDVDVARDRATIRRDYHHGLASLVGEQTLSAYSPENLAAARGGRVVVTNDTSTDERTASHEQAYRLAGIRAHVALPLLSDGKWVSTLLVSTHEARAWRSREVALIQSVAERTWLWFQHFVAQEKFRIAIEAAPTGMILTDMEGKIVLLNSPVEELFGYTRQELLGQPIEALVPERFRARHPGMRAGFADAARAARPMGAAGRALFGLRKDGSEMPIEIGLNPIRTSEGKFVLSSVLDITEHKRAEREREEFLAQLRALNAELEERVDARTAELSRTLKEREVLLQEVHHRVKNNLQVISSLINMQIRKLEAGAGRSALVECRTRVEAIALIHDQLYQSRDYASIPFSEYAGRLARNVFDASESPSANVRLEVAIEDISMPVDRAIPCALILNELITNALKHAFPNEREGRVKIELRLVDGDEVLLAVTDDGIGMPADFNPESVGSLGMQLVCTLTEQLDGQLEILRDAGTSFRIRFPMEARA